MYLNEYIMRHYGAEEAQYALNEIGEGTAGLILGCGIRGGRRARAAACARSDGHAYCFAVRAAFDGQLCRAVRYALDGDDIDLGTGDLDDIAV